MIAKTDTQIHQDVLQELRWDPRVNETEVGVEVNDGVVTLTGTVDSYAKKVAALQAAHRVVGVLDVANNVEVHIPHVGARTDTEIAQAVRDALQWDVFIKNEKIATTVANGFVTLEGHVDSVYEKKDAESALKGLAGVKGVINKIIVTPKKIDADKVRNSIELALKRRADHAAHDVRVVVNDHTIVLEGKVPTWSEKQTVVDAAGYIPGITSVVDHIRIMPSLVV